MKKKKEMLYTMEQALDLIDDRDGKEFVKAGCLGLVVGAFLFCPAGALTTLFLLWFMG